MIRLRNFAEIPVFPRPTLDIDSVAAIFFTRAGSYLMQRRDNKDGLPLRDHWVLFGGVIELGETAEAALLRELNEELCFVARQYSWFSEMVLALPRARDRMVRRVFYAVPVSEEDVAGMKLREGAEMKLLKLEELICVPRISPWDLAALLMHARGAAIFES